MFHLDCNMVYSKLLYIIILLGFMIPKLSLQRIQSCSTIPREDGIPFLSFYLGVLDVDSSTWKNELRTSNLLHISPKLLDRNSLILVLEEIRETGCFAMVDLDYDVQTTVSDFNSSTWNWLIPIIEEYSDIIKALYLEDEPFWDNQEFCVSKVEKCFNNMNDVCDLIHSTTNHKIPIVVTLAYQSIQNWEIHKYPSQIPSGIDWIGMDCYSNNFSDCWGWSIRKYYDFIISHTNEENQFFTIIPPTWQSIHYRLDPTEIFNVYQGFYNMIKEIGFERFKLIMPFLWDVPTKSVDYHGAKYYPLLSLWWDLVFSNNSFFSTFDTYFDGLIFSCEDDEEDCKDIFDPIVVNSVNLVYNDQIHPIRNDAFINCGCRDNKYLKIQVQDEITQRLKKLKVGSIITVEDLEITDFLTICCYYSFPFFQKPIT